MNLNELTCFPFFAFHISLMGVQDAQIINKLENKLLLSWLLFSLTFLVFILYFNRNRKKKNTMTL